MLNLSPSVCMHFCPGTFPPWNTFTQTCSLNWTGAKNFVLTSHRHCWPVRDKTKEQQFRKVCHDWVSRIVKVQYVLLCCLIWLLLILMNSDSLSTIQHLAWFHCFYWPHMTIFSLLLHSMWSLSHHEIMSVCKSPLYFWKQQCLCWEMLFSKQLCRHHHEAVTPAHVFLCAWICSSQSIRHIYPPINQSTYTMNQSTLPTSSSACKHQRQVQ